MNIFDSEITKFVNEFSQHSLIFDKMVFFLSINHLLKGGVLVIILWWAFFVKHEDQSNNRKHILITIISCVFAIAVARVLELTLPFRFRPIHQEGMSFLIPCGAGLDTLEGWSSFPSDHAVLFFTLSVGILFISNKIGLFSIIYTTLFICFPRIYLGLHYPTDIIAGAFIGVIIAAISNIYFLKHKWLQSIENWSHSKPNYFYPLFFLFTYQLADTFDDSRTILSIGWKFLKMI